MRLLVKETEDRVTRENMQRIQKEISETQVILKGQWRFIQLTFEAAVTNFKYPHKLDFVPKDAWLTSTTNGMAVIFNYDEFDRTNIDITTSEGGTMRALIGNIIDNEGLL